MRIPGTNFGRDALGVRIDTIRAVAYQHRRAKFGTARAMRQSLFMRVTRSRSARRHLAAALVLCASTGQLGNLAHLAVVRHAVCLEHGELVHADDERIRPSGHARDKRESANASLQPRSDSSAAHGHDHCGATAHQREFALPRAPCCEGVALPAASGVDSIVERPAQNASWAIFRLAPKASPPV
jgi:hypothetical protein